jgi:hypothetical protein
MSYLCLEIGLISIYFALQDIIFINNMLPNITLSNSGLEQSASPNVHSKLAQYPATGSVLI